MSEFEPDRQIDGGYVERSRFAAFAAWLRSDQDTIEHITDPPVAEVKVDDHH